MIVQYVTELSYIQLLNKGYLQETVEPIWAILDVVLLTW